MPSHEKTKTERPSQTPPLLNGAAGSPERGAPTRHGVGEHATHGRRRRRREAFRLRGRLNTWQYIATSALVFAAVFAAWATATAIELVDPLFLPAPGEVFGKLWELAADGMLFEDTKISVVRIMVGFLLATVMAVPVGVLIGTYKIWEAALEPLTDFIRTCRWWPSSR
jgi:heme/copper-type cytochrome/quinol oxidase subunit 3